MDNNGNTGNEGYFTAATHYHLEESHSTSKEEYIEGGCEHVIATKTAYTLSEGNITTGSVGCFPDSNTQFHDEACQWSSHTGFANVKHSIDILQVHYGLHANKNQRGEEHQVLLNLKETYCSKQRIHR